MILLLKILGIALACAVLLGAAYLNGWLIAAAWYRLTGEPEVYPPEAAEVPHPVDEHFKTAPTDDLDTAVDWHRYEYEMKRKQT